jgi:MFS family permease
MMLGMLSLIGLFVTFITMLRARLSWVLVSPLLAIFGLGSLAFAPAALAMLGDFAPERGRGTTMGVYSVVISLGTIIGPILGGYLLDKYGLSSLLYAGLVILIAALAIAIILGGPYFTTIPPVSATTNTKRT